MTGEMFSLLKAHALIGSEMTGTVADDEAFAQGVADAAQGDLLGALFGVRPAALLGLRAEGEAASYVSGLLIGSDVRTHLGGAGDVYVLADPALGELYARAIAVAGVNAHFVDSHAAFVAGIKQIEERLR